MCGCHIARATGGKRQGLAVAPTLGVLILVPLHPRNKERKEEKKKTAEKVENLLKRKLRVKDQTDEREVHNTCSCEGVGAAGMPLPIE